MTEAQSLMSVYSGWDGHEKALVEAISELTAEQLAWNPAPNLRAVGNLVVHIITGRFYWIHEILGVENLATEQWIKDWSADPEFQGRLKIGTNQNALALISGLEATWQMVEGALTTWTTDDLNVTQPHEYRGKVYAISRQWILWRIMCHDIHHGGELAYALGIQDIHISDLGDLGGHITEPLLMEP